MSLEPSTPFRDRVGLRDVYFDLDHYKFGTTISLGKTPLLTEFHPPLPNMYLPLPALILFFIFSSVYSYFIDLLCPPGLESL